MKKAFVLIAVLLLSLSVLFACEKTDTDYNISNFDSESRFQVEIEPDNNTSQGNDNNTEASRVEIQNATFLVKDKKYVYKENDVVLLDITNETEQNLSITITMTYFDEAGEALKTEERFFEQFAAGYQNYFLFNPDMVFDTYSYTISACAFDGEVIINKYEFKFVGLEETRSLANYDENMNMLPNPENKYYPTLEARVTFSSTHTVKMYVGVDMLLFNEQDELVAICKFGPPISPKLEIGKECKNAVLYQTKVETMVWPEQYVGDIRAVFCFIDTKEYVPH